MDRPEPRREGGRPLRSLATEPSDMLDVRGCSASICDRSSGSCHTRCQPLPTSSVWNGSCAVLDAHRDQARLCGPSRPGTGEQTGRVLTVRSVTPMGAK